jgi:hypothetical protein
MPTLNGDTLPYGLNQVVPAESRSAWGARLIVTQDGWVDFVADRQGAAGEDRDTFLTMMDTQLPLGAMLDSIRELLRSGEMDTRVDKDFVIFQSDEIEVHANTNASAGYCYVAAFLRP